MSNVLGNLKNEFSKLNDEIDDEKRLDALSSQLEMTSRHNRAPSTPGTTAAPGNEDLIPLTSTRAATRKLTLREEIWRVFEEPTSSRLSLIVAFVVVAMILVSVSAFVVQSLPEYVWSNDPAWLVVEIVCITVFTLEFGIRLACCPSVLRFFKAPLNLVDLLAILPFYVEVVLPGVGGSSSAAIIRVVRLVRIFRIFKPLLMLVFVVMIAMIVFASAMYYVERGEWSDEENAFIRTVRDVKSISPFQSIPASMWWAIITMTTVGYGDVYPVTPLGKLVAAIAALCGILVIAIPITVISTNFNGEYAKLERERSKVKARMLLLRHHFKARKAGLEAVLDEVDDLVRRNTQEFASEVESLFEQSRAELTEEIQEIVRMAFERRRQLHLAALAAGRVQGYLTVDANHQRR